MTCPKDFESVEQRINRVLTQYRESPKLLHLIRTYLRQVEIIEQAICDLPSSFDIETAIGDQLTLLGRRMGWPRSHCICETQPVFGFDCDTDNSQQILGLCTSADWSDCITFGVAYVEINDDDLYRKFLQVRRYQMLAYFDRESLIEAIKIFWGDKAEIVYSSLGRVVVAPGRELTALEQSYIQLYPRVLPIALGIDVRFHFPSFPIFGFGAGWGGFCEGKGYDELRPLQTESLEDIQTQTDKTLFIDFVGLDAEWLCATNVRPYDCN